MSPEEFRRYGYRVVDWIADYWKHLESLPVAPRVEPGDILRRLPAHPPEQGQPFDAVLSDLDELVVPGLLHWQHPRFFGYFPANSSGPAVLADLLCSGLGVQGISGPPARHAPSWSSGCSTGWRKPSGCRSGSGSLGRAAG
jgi:aromatic-L-amino-acid/L-tryptophan decarboxylase